MGSEFLDDAARWLADGAELRLKTDFSPHVDALLAALPGRPFELVGLSRDVARYGPPWTDEVVTAYQAAFDRKGVPVHAVRIARRR